MYLKRLQDTREDKDLLQKQIAIILEITRQQYSLYESGKRMIPIDKLVKLANFYNTSTDYLLGLTDEIKPYPRKEKKDVWISKKLIEAYISAIKDFPKNFDAVRKNNEIKRNEINEKYKDIKK